VEFEYDRHGTLAYLGAYDVHRAVLIGQVAPKTGIAPFAELVTQVMTTEPYASARRVFWIVDNGSSHAGQASITRMRQGWPTATLVHLPGHASWLNQIEIVFSVIQRKVVQPADFADLDALAWRLIDFEPRYNAAAAPFDWRFTRADLTDLLRRIDAHRDRQMPALAAGTGKIGAVATPPASTKTSLGQRVSSHARSRWPALAGVQVRFRGQFAYIDGRLPDGEILRLCRLRYAGSASVWGFAIYLASTDGLPVLHPAQRAARRQPRRRPRLRLWALPQRPHRLAAPPNTDELRAGPPVRNSSNRKHQPAGQRPADSLKAISWPKSGYTPGVVAPLVGPCALRLAGDS
jgi:hypothetical protein